MTALPHSPANPASQFLFVRHGQTDWNLEHRVQGSTDIPLNGTGLEQAHAAARQLQGAGASLIVASPLLRAYRTAEIIAETLNLPLQVDVALSERGFGGFEGTLLSDLPRSTDPKLPFSVSDIADPAAEPMSAVFARVERAVEQYIEQRPDEYVILVSHGALFRALTLKLTGASKPANNAYPYRFTKRETWRVDDLAGADL